jgi:acyl carrier protein
MMLVAGSKIGGVIMNIGRAAPLHQAAPVQALAISDLYTLIARHLGVDIDSVTREAHFTNDLGADWLDRVELIMAIEERFGLEITDDDVEQIQLVGDLFWHLQNRS